MAHLYGFPPLAPGPGLDCYPADPGALRRRMAAVYGVDPAQVLPTRGATHALELVLRAVKGGRGGRIAGDGARLVRLAAIYGLEIGDQTPDVRVVCSPSIPEGSVLSAEDAVRLAAGLAPGLLVVDESGIEFSERPSIAPLTAELANLVVLRSLSQAYGMPGARCGAAVACRELIKRLTAMLEPDALPGPTLAAAEAAMSPSRALTLAARVALVREERERLWRALADSPLVGRVVVGEGPFLYVEPAPDATLELERWGISARPAGEGLCVPVAMPDHNDRVLEAFGAASSGSPRRRGEVVRDTRETRISVTVDLDRTDRPQIATGIAFYDHMLEQVASHAGISVRLGCEGDLEVDPHHTVEDSALALGAALKQALGDRAGIGRYGFVTPMDEAEAAVSLDLSGRPYAVFEGEFTAERIGDYPTALTRHVFRSLADSLGAAIHVRVTGQDDHHKTEACFKAFGRALRQAVRMEGGGVPSTKGTLT